MRAFLPRFTWQELSPFRPESSARHSTASTICLRAQDGHCPTPSALPTESLFTRLGLSSSTERMFGRMAAFDFASISEKYNQTKSTRHTVAFAPVVKKRLPPFSRLFSRLSSRLAAAKPFFISLFEGADQVASIPRHDFSALNERAQHSILIKTNVFVLRIPSLLFIFLQSLSIRHPT